VKRRILIACCTFVTVAGSIAVASPAQAECPYGTVPTRFEGVCTKGQGGSPPPGIVVPPQGAQVAVAPGSIPTLNGIPCNDSNANTCWAMAQQG
jgi:hypothetical protein